MDGGRRRCRAGRAGGRAGRLCLSAGRRDGGAVRLHQVPPALPLRGAQPGPAALQGPGEELGAGCEGAVREGLRVSLWGLMWEEADERGV